MIEQFLRRISVSRRMVGGFLILVLLLVLATPLIVTQHNFLTHRVQQISEVETRADRLLLLANANIQSSRVNLLRFIADYSPSVNATLDEIDAATQLLTEAHALLPGAEQQETIDTFLEALADYRDLVTSIAEKHQAGEEQVTRLLFQASRLGNDISAQLERISDRSEKRLAETNAAFQAEGKNRLIFLLTIYGIVLLGALVLVILVAQSVTRPVAELRSGAEALRAGHMDTTIPVAGNDELSLLAQTFNELAAQLQEMIGGLEHLVAERTRSLQTAAQVAHATTQLLDTEDLLQTVVDLVREHFGLYYVGLFLVDETQQYAVLQAGTGEAGRTMIAHKHQLRIGGASMIGQCVARDAARIALDVGKEAVRFDNPLLPETRSELALPLRSRGRVIGAMTVQSTQESAFDETDIAVMQTMANQVAVAIDNARLFTQTQAALESAEAAYRRYLGQAWTGYLPTARVTRYETRAPGVEPADDAILPEIQQAITRGTSVVLRDDDGHSALVAPCTLRGEIIGALGIHDDGTRQWTQDEITLIQEVAERMALAAENLRLLDGTQRRAARERFIREITNQMHETMNINAILQTAVRRLGQALEAEEIAVRLVPGETNGGAAQRSE